MRFWKLYGQQPSEATLPFVSAGAASVRLELSSGVFEVSGRNLAIETTGEAQYVEDLPEDIRPFAES